MLPDRQKRYDAQIAVLCFAISSIRTHFCMRKALHPDSSFFYPFYVVLFCFQLRLIHMMHSEPHASSETSHPKGADCMLTHTLSHTEIQRSGSDCRELVPRLGGGANPRSVCFGFRGVDLLGCSCQPIALRFRGNGPALGRISSSRTALGSGWGKFQVRWNDASGSSNATLVSHRTSNTPFGR